MVATTGEPRVIPALPTGWTREQLGKMGKWLSGGTPSTANPDFWGGAVPWVTAKDMKRSRLWGAIDHVTEAALGNGTRLAPKEALLLVVRGMILAHTFPVARAEVPLAFNQDIKALVLGDAVDSDFLLWSLIANEPLFLGIATESTHGTKRIPSRGLHSVELALPTLPEQRAIAVALSDVDALLDGLDRLIAKKRDLKQAATQQLLTGQTRLPGFYGEWQVKRLGDLGVFLKGDGVTKDQSSSGSLACVRYGELYTQHNNVIRSFSSWISPEVAVTATRLRSGDILFAGSGETKEEIGKCAAFVDKREAYAGGDIVILRPHSAEPIFLGYLLNTASINRQKASRGQGDAVVHISTSALAAICCRIPELREQSAIAAVLSDMDAEITALEARRNKTNDLKQAMMQELLTGKTRLIQPEAAHA